MSRKRSYDLFKEYPLGNFFLLVFIFVGLIASYWYFHRRTNSYAHLREDGIDIMAPYYDSHKAMKIDKQMGKFHEAKPEGEDLDKEATESKEETHESK